MSEFKNLISHLMKNENYQDNHIYCVTIFSYDFVLHLLIIKIKWLAEN